MATKQEIEQELKEALKEIGKIEPVFDEDVGEWVFSSPRYPVEYGGATKSEVKEKFPLYLRKFIEERIKGNLNPLVEKKTKGRGGFRPGAGRPEGTKKEAKKRIYLPEDLADWIKEKENLKAVLVLKKKSCRDSRSSRKVVSCNRRKSSSVSSARGKNK